MIVRSYRVEMIKDYKTFLLACPTRSKVIDCFFIRVSTWVTLDMKIMVSGGSVSCDFGRFLDCFGRFRAVSGGIYTHRCGINMGWNF